MPRPPQAGHQLHLFPDLAPPPRQRRHTYTMAEFRQVRRHYTEGWLKGPEMAKRLGVDYASFRYFVKRNPELQKRRATLSP